MSDRSKIGWRISWFRSHLAIPTLDVDDEVNDDDGTVGDRLFQTILLVLNIQNVIN